VRILASQNRLTSLSPNFESHTSLEVCELAENELEILPFESVVLPKLRSLDLRNNKIKALPTKMAELTGLRQLELSGNPLDLAMIAAAASGPPDVLAMLNKQPGGKSGPPQRPDGMFDGIVESINTPGVNPGVIKAGYVIFGALIFFDMILFIALGPSIHVLVLFLLSVGVFGSMQWFIGELVQAQDEHDRMVAAGELSSPDSEEVKKDK
jgi:hypothetical protein